MRSSRLPRRAAKMLVHAVSHQWCTRDRIARELGMLGVRPGCVLLVHSSLSSLGFVIGGAHAVIDALRSAVGREGTLVMPAHSWDRAGRGDFSFDARRTPSCVGAISEMFRTLPYVTRSLHPTHSVAALGPLARYLTEGHESSPTPCGPSTPYSKLIEMQSSILFLGTRLERNTLFHTLEAFAGARYLMREDEEWFIVTDASGRTRRLKFRRHNRGPERNFAATETLLASTGSLRKGKVGSSDSLLVESAPMSKVVLDLLRVQPEALLAKPAWTMLNCSASSAARRRPDPPNVS